MPVILFIAIAFLLGSITPIYLPMNSSVARYVSSPILANLSFFFMALLATVIALGVALMVSPGINGVEVFSKFRSVPTYLYLSGVISALLILGTTALIPRLGASTFFVLFVSGQVLMALIVSHFGLLESPQDPISTQKVFGVVFLIIGVSLSTIKGFDFWTVPVEFVSQSWTTLIGKI